MNKLLLTLLIISFLNFLGCGYKVGFKSGDFIFKDIKQLCVYSINNPTIYSFIDKEIRSYLKDEIVKRTGIKWVSCDKADGLLYIDIVSYSDATRVENVKEQTLKSELVLRFKVKLLNARDQKELWRSGIISAKESYLDSSDKKRAEIKLIKDAVEKIVDGLTESF